MKAYVESYENGNQIIKICGDDDEILERIEVSAVIIENHIPLCFRPYPDVKMNIEIARN